MNIIFISPNYPSCNRQFAAALHSAGASVLGLGDSPDLRPDLREVLQDYYAVADMHDYDAVYRAAAWHISRHGRIGRIVSLIPYWYPLEERLSYDFRIPIAEKDPKTLTSFLPALHAGIPVPEFYPAKDVTALKKKNEAPFFFRCFNGWQEDTLLTGISAPTEEGEFFLFPEGELISIEGAAGKKGKILTACGLSFINFPDKNANGQGSSFFTFEPDEAQKNICRKLIPAYGLSDSLFHFSFLKTGEKLTFLRAWNTPSGGFLSCAPQLCGNTGLQAVWAKMLTGKRSAPVTKRFRPAAYTARCFSRSYAHTHPEILKKFGDMILSHGLTHENGNSGTGDYFYILRADPPEKARNAIAFIQCDF